MKLSLQEVMSEAVTAYPQNLRTEWVLSWPGQVVLASSIIYWTKEVTQVVNTGNSKPMYSLLFYVHQHET